MPNTLKYFFVIFLISFCNVARGGLSTHNVRGLILVTGRAPTTGYQNTFRSENGTTFPITKMQALITPGSGYDLLIASPRLEFIQTHLDRILAHGLKEEDIGKFIIKFRTERGLREAVEKMTKVPLHRLFLLSFRLGDIDEASRPPSSITIEASKVQLTTYAGGITPLEPPTTKLNGNTRHGDRSGPSGGSGPDGGCGGLLH